MKRPDRRIEFEPTCKQADETFKIAELFESSNIGIFRNSTGLLISREVIVEDSLEPVTVNDKNQISIF